MKYMGNVTEHFAVPHPAPEPVEQASALFEETSAAFQEARAKYHRLVTSRLDDITEANRQAAAARINGTKSTARTEAKIDADIAKAKSEMDVGFEATDATGTALMQAVAKARDEWVKVYEAAEAEAGERIDTLTALLQQATDDLGNARSAADWLRSRSATQYPAGSGHSLRAFSELEKLVHGELRLVGYREGEALWERVRA